MCSILIKNNLKNHIFLCFPLPKYSAFIPHIARSAAVNTVFSVAWTYLNLPTNYDLFIWTCSESHPCVRLEKKDLCMFLARLMEESPECHAPSDEVCNKLSLLGNILTACFTENYPLKYVMTSLKQNIYKPLLYNCLLLWGSELAEVGRPF